MYAKRESRTLGNVGETLIGWALLQLLQGAWRFLAVTGPQDEKCVSLLDLNRSEGTCPCGYGWISKEV
jgi:hypothetical protein